jgi:hypothetical protein
LDATGTIQTTTDSGVNAGSNTVTTKAWQASFSLSEDFRASFLEQVGALTPRSVFQGQAQSVFNIESLNFLMAQRKKGAHLNLYSKIKNLSYISKNIKPGIYRVNTKTKKIFSVHQSSISS